MNASTCDLPSTNLPAGVGGHRPDPAGARPASDGLDPPAPAALSEAHPRGADGGRVRLPAPTAGDGSAAGEGARLGPRLVRTLVVFAFWFLLELLVKAVTVLQLVHVACKKRPHLGMQRLGDMIGEYTYGLWRYCTFASHQTPWPFSPWPRGEGRAESR